MNGQVHWHEGLFLLPHHLQMMQRSLQQQVASDRRLGWPYPHGLLEAAVSTDALANMLVQFDRLRAVMPSGVMVNISENATLPPLDIQAPFKASGDALTILLAVPLWNSNRGNALEPASDDWQAKRLYRVREHEAADENTGQNAQKIFVRDVNARLITDADDQTDLEVLPILRIEHRTDERTALPRLDPGFVPPCMVVSAWPTLRDLARDISNHVEATRKDLVRQLQRDGVSLDNLRGKQFELIMRLMIANRYSARLPELLAAPGLTPFELYMELRGLISELAALQPARDPFACPDYDHREQATVFHDLQARIRELCQAGPDGSVQSVKLVRDDRRFAAELSEQHFATANEFFLGVRTREDPRTVTTLVEDKDKFKLMPFSLRGKKIYGVPLEREPNPPVQLPAETGLHYFRLLRDENPRWDQVVQERKIVVEGRDVESSDFDLTLYMTVPGSASAAGVSRTDGAAGSGPGSRPPTNPTGIGA